MKQFDIYLVDLNPTIGREQFGKRPVLIVSNNYENLLDIVTIVPITSLKAGRRVYPNELLLESELEKPSILLCHQIRSISKKRLIKKLTSINSFAMQKRVIEVLCLRFKEV